MNLHEFKQLDRIFHPRGFALFGGIGTPGSFGHLIALSQIRYGYQGNLYPISSKGGEIAGVPVYNSLKEIKTPVDLASISVPAKAVSGVLHECQDHGVAGVQIHSSGFAELGTQEGVARQEEIMELAHQGIRVVGPNCFGIHCPAGGITILPGSGFSKEPGSVALISQSGGVATDFGYEADAAGIRLSKVISFGNGCDLDAIQLMDYLVWDPMTKMIAAYIEGIADGQLFVETVRRATCTKPVIIWKAGLTPLGSQAARSHTAALAGEAQIWKGALAQAGALPVQGLDEIMDALTALQYLENPGKKIALVGGGGAIGVFSCDLAFHAGLDLPRFSLQTQKCLKKHFPTPGNSMANPLDTGTPVVPVDVLKKSIKEVLLSESIDILVLVLLLRSLEVEMPTFLNMIGVDSEPPGSYLQELLPVLARLKAQSGKDMVVVFENRAAGVADVDVERTGREMRAAFQSRGIPVFSSVPRALRGIKHAVAFKSHRQRAE